jgi:hypothetical protein
VGDLAVEFEQLVGPLNNDPSSLGSPVLVMTKALVDGIDPRPLKAFLGDAQPGELSLGLLKRSLQRLGDDADVSAPLRALQAFRSKGGIAHIAGSGRAGAEAELGVSGLSPWEAFNMVAKRLTRCLDSIVEMIHSATDDLAE